MLHRRTHPYTLPPSPVGIIDYAGFPKDNFYYYLSRWGGDPLGNGTGPPVAHLLPHWNWEADAHGSITNTSFPGRVWVHTNCEEAELFVNGISLGRKRLQIVNTTQRNDHKPSVTQHIEWNSTDNIAYQRGALKVVAYRGGQAVVTNTIKTAGAPHAVLLSVDFGSTLEMNGQDVALIRATIIDADGAY